MPLRPRRERLSRRTASLLLALVATVVAAAGAFAAVEHGRSPLATHLPPATPSTGSPAPLSDLGEPPGLPDQSPTSTGAAPALAGGTVAVPVLMYHYIRVDRNACDRLGQGLSVTPANFSAQLDLLQAGGFHVVSLDEVMTAVLGGGRLPAKALALTFDDGYADFATAAVPILIAHGMAATDFVVPGFLGHSNYMSQAQLLQVAATGMTIGAHTMHHVALAHVPAAVATAEIDQSRTVLQQLTGASVDDFAYPYGDHDAAVEGMVAAAGFREAFTTLYGTHLTPAARYALPRVRVSDGTSGFMQALGIPSTVRALALAHRSPVPAGVPNAAGVAPPPSACGTPATPIPSPAPVAGAGSTPRLVPE